MSPEDRHGNPGGTLLLALLDLFLLGVVGCLAWLREDPLFWRNAGGWPVGLRSLVRVGFLPLVALHAGLLLWLTWQGLRGLSPRREGVLLLVPLALLWLGTGGVGAWLLANNLANLLDGRPFHWHPG